MLFEKTFRYVNNATCAVFAFDFWSLVFHPKGVQDLNVIDVGKSSVKRFWTFMEKALFEAGMKSSMYLSVYWAVLYKKPKQWLWGVKWGQTSLRACVGHMLQEQSANRCTRGYIDSFLCCRGESLQEQCHIWKLSTSCPGMRTRLILPLPHADMQNYSIQLNFMEHLARTSTFSPE